MKKLIAIALLALAACDNDPAPANPPIGGVVDDGVSDGEGVNECPRSDGEACK